MKRLVVDYRITNEDNCVEHFTLRNLDSINIVNRNNCNTRSCILAPYNTSFKEQQENSMLEIKQDVQISINNEAVFYPLCVIDLNKQYEIQNKGDLAQGIIVNKNINSSFDLDASIYREEKDKKARKNPDSAFVQNLKLSNFKDAKEINASYGVYNDSILAQMETLGYTKDYIIQSLRSNELNYCTACYNLLMKKVEPIDI